MNLLGLHDMPRRRLSNKVLFLRTACTFHHGDTTIG